jgi:hypothetical protein
MRVERVRRDLDRAEVEGDAFLFPECLDALVDLADPLRAAELRGVNKRGILTP